MLFPSKFTNETNVLKDISCMGWGRVGGGQRGTRFFFKIVNYFLKIAKNK